MRKGYFFVPVMLVSSGCASVINGSTHPVKIETKTESGELIKGADCTLTNNKFVVQVKSGDTANVHRDGKDLQIVCTHAGEPDALGRAISRVSGAMFGNIILGGGIGAVIDHNRGTAYTCPEWVQLVFGKSLVFDRHDNKDGEPTPPTLASADKAASP